jgi:hypothetical protein
MFTSNVELSDIVNAPTPENIIQLRYNPTMITNINEVLAFIVANGPIDTVKYTNEQTRNNIHDEYKKYDEIKNILNDRITYTEIIKTIQDIRQSYIDIGTIETAIHTDLTQLDDAYIANEVDTYIHSEQTKEETKLNTELA